MLGAARVAPEKAVFRPALPMSFLPGIAEMRMGKMTYAEQLRHPHWQKKRLEVMQSASFSCENCGDAETTLNVHHKRYVKGRMAWEYELRELQCLCEACHRSDHELREKLDLLLMESGMGLAAVVALLAGYFDGHLSLDEPVEIPSGFSMEFDLGVLASILDGQMPDAMHAAFKGSRVAHLNPVQEAAVARWLDFTEKLEKSGL